MSVQIHRITGANWGAKTGTNITSGSTKANAADSHITDNSSPIKIPNDAAAYSYWVTTTLYTSDTSNGTIDNVKWYGAWNLDTIVNSGIGYQIATISGLATNYTQATAHGTKESSGSDMYDTFNGQSYFENYYGYHTSTIPSGIISTNPISFGSIQINSATSAYLDKALVYQVVVSGNASPGSTATQTFYWQYDES